MRKRLILGLVLCNILIGFVVLATPVKTQIFPRGIIDCCKVEGDEGYCCHNCCWLAWPCDSDEDCKDVQDK